MRYSLVVTKHNFQGSYFDALEEMQIIAPEMFDLCEHHAAEQVVIEIEFIMKDNGSKDLRAVLHYDEDDDDDDEFDHEPSVPDAPVKPATSKADLLDEFLSRIDELIITKRSAVVIA